MDVSQLQTNAQALAALRTANAILGKAALRARDVAGLFQRGAFNAAMNLIDQRRGYIERVAKDVPLDDGPVTPILRTRVGLALSQAESALIVIDKVAKDDKSFAAELAEALAAILRGALEALGKPTGILLWEILKQFWPVILIVLFIVFLNSGRKLPV